MGRLTAVRSRLSTAKAPSPNRVHRASARDRGYTARWDRTSKAFLDENPLCLGCEAMDVTAAATLTDHVVPHRGNHSLFWEPDNWQPSCGWHHNVVKQLLEQKFDAGEIGADDLRLDSEIAIEIATRERPTGRAGQKSGT